MRDLPGLNKFPKVSFSIKMCIKISLKENGGDRAARVVEDFN